MEGWRGGRGAKDVVQVVGVVVVFARWRREGLRGRHGCGRRQVVVAKHRFGINAQKVNVTVEKRLQISRTCQKVWRGKLVVWRR